MRLQDQVYEAYKNNINRNMEENRKGALAMKEALEKSPLNYNGVLEKTLQIPKVFDAETVEQFKEITELANSINIHLQDGRPVRFDFTPIPTPQTAP